ncbi:uncharacterized protein LOC130800770 [Amaranthus tricolor]|uniref:uncharacterized protein LOC130800770 n=1 Tax=Amaranthus tricolor TaxID=29722 RepID=UPI00258A6C82|nr:uncharacterized protein LOC130800770 [Amaranthus tricolor]
MKKFFFFRSSTEKIVSSEKSPNVVQQNKGSDSSRLSKTLDVGNDFGLRRSRSFSSAAFLGNSRERNLLCLSDQSSSSSTSSESVKTQQHNRSSRYCTLTPERQVKSRRQSADSHDNDFGGWKPAAVRSLQASYRSRNASISSSDVSNEVLDLYIDGEQHYQQGSPRNKASAKSHTRAGRVKKPPRVHYTAPGSLVGSIKDKPRTDSFRGAKGADHHLSSRDWVEAGFRHESSQELAKRVVEKLCQSRDYSRINLNNPDPDVPITIDDVYSKSLRGEDALKLNNPSCIELPSDTPAYGFQAEHCQCLEHDSYGSCDAGDDDEFNMELKSKFKEAQDRILVLSEELEQESFLLDVDYNVPALIHRIRNLAEEKISLALEVSAALENQIADRTSLKEQLTSAELDFDLRMQRLLEEKNEMQLTLEKELDRRSSDWSLKVEKYETEEQRLRERVRELAEQNVSLQREVSSFSETETERKNMITLYEKQIKDLTSMLELAREENRALQDSNCELQEKYKTTEEGRVFIQRSFGEKEEECKQLHSCVTRLVKTCSEQEKAMEGLRGELMELVQKKHDMDSFDKHIQKLQMEQIRLIGVELSLRREIESYKQEVDSLRIENVKLLERLKACGKGGGSITFKLDEELSARLLCLQKQGLSLINDSIHLSSKLLEFMKKTGQIGGKMDGVDTQFIIESDTRVQGFKRGSESLMKSLQLISTTLHGRSDLVASESQTENADDDRCRILNEWNSTDSTESELKAEMLLTSLLRDKLYSKDQEVERLQAELATAARGNGILRFEVQNALDSFSCVTHKMKELELQMMKKDDKMNQLQNDLEESLKELSIIQGILPKVTEERDIMWEEVKQYTEKNMLLNSEVNMLKKKVEALDEDILVKEGQITILKDTLGSKSFDLLASPDQIHEFLLE